MRIVELEKELKKIGVPDDLYSIMIGGGTKRKVMYYKRRYMASVL